PRLPLTDGVDLHRSRPMMDHTAHRPGAPAISHRSQKIPSPPSGAPGQAKLLKAGRGFFQPDIWIVDADGDARVWKTWQRRPAPERFLVGRWLAKREGLTIRALQDMEGFPALLGWPDPATVEMTLMNAEPVPEVK